MVLIPLRDHSGTVVARAIVDDADADLAKFSWCRHSCGYVYRMANDERGRRPVLLHREICGLVLGDGLYDDECEAGRVVAEARRQHMPWATS